MKQGLASDCPFGLVRNLYRMRNCETGTDFPGLFQPAAERTGPLLLPHQIPGQIAQIEILSTATLDSLSGFKWTGPDPLSNSTRACDIFLHMSALLFPKEVQWIEFRLSRVG
jgi:hypothetical protein